MPGPIAAATAALPAVATLAAQPAAQPAVATLAAAHAAALAAAIAVALTTATITALSVCDQLDILRGLQCRYLLVERRHFKIRGSQRQPTDLCKSEVPETGLVLHERWILSG